MTVRHRRAFLRAGIIIFAVVGLFGTSYLRHNVSFIFCSQDWDGTTSHLSNSGEFDSLIMTERKCRATFPGLFREIDDSVSRGSFSLEKAPSDYTGLVQGRIKEGKLYIISSAHDVAEEKVWWRSSILHSLHRAIITSPEPLPDIHFSLVINDSPRSGSWSFSRSHSFDANPPSSWLMPHFSFWSWPLPFIRSMEEALLAIEQIEKETKWEEKASTILWRGTSWFNGIGIPDLRPKLLEVTKGKPWADVEALEWIGGFGVGTAKNAKRIEDFCRNRYIAYTEGVTYSGRLPFHQACASVILTPPVTHLQHTSHLIRPLFSSSLPLPPSTKTWTPSRIANATWPIHYPPEQANIVFVAPDWSDLEAVIAFFNSEENHILAEGIARRQRELFVGGGYFGTGADACYWRALVRGWSQVAKVKKEDDGAWEDGEGMRWETFAVTGRTSWEQNNKRS